VPAGGAELRRDRGPGGRRRERRGRRRACAPGDGSRGKDKVQDGHPLHVSWTRQADAWFLVYSGARLAAAGHAPAALLTPAHR